jgi:HlyD family secretion protein
VLPEIQNGTIKLLVTLDQPHHPLLRNKLRVEANIVTELKDRVLIVPAGPAFNGRGRQDAWIVRDGVAHKTPLDLGNSDGKFVEVTGGARAGERIIISDIKRFKDRDTLRIAN